MEQGALALGAPNIADVEAVAAAIDRRHGVFSLQVDLDRPKSVMDFFNIMIGQFGHLDTVVVETVRSPVRNISAEKLIELSSRRLLHCLDAALRYSEGDLHIISVAPIAGGIVIPVATAFLAAKCATAEFASVPQLRMSTVAPAGAEASEEASLARTVLHLMRERRSPDITETMLCRPPIARPHTRSAHMRAKMSIHM
jgi:NADP-dependent 3-hydroxy acid dehydrogenase YdfG